MDIKNMHEILEKLVGCAKAELDKKGIDEIDTEEMGKVTDIIKDLAEAQYYRTLVVAMEESEYGEDYNEEVVVEGSVDTSKVGTYLINYYLNDDKFNITLTRVVNVLGGESNGE
jgi:hypothetical protein